MKGRAVRLANRERLEHLARFQALLAENPTLYLPGYDAVFELPAGSRIFFRIARDLDYEPRVRAMIGEHLDTTGDFLDIGANVGLHAVFAAKRYPHATGPRVFAVEPNPVANSMLRRNLARNAVEGTVQVLDLAVSDRRGHALLRFAEEEPEFSTLESHLHRAAKHPDAERMVPLITLDALVEEHGIKPSFIKIDVEGHESSVIAGALDTLEEYHPALLMELAGSEHNWSTDQASEILDHLNQVGYTPRGARISELSGRRVSTDVLFTPTPSAR
ncbi:MAG: FkbM family methyltransferase [Actinomycetota bacterium]